MKTSTPWRCAWAAVALGWLGMLGGGGSSFKTFRNQFAMPSILCIHEAHGNATSPPRRRRVVDCRRERLVCRLCRHTHLWCDERKKLRQALTGRRCCCVDVDIGESTYHTTLRIDRGDKIDSGLWRRRPEEMSTSKTSSMTTGTAMTLATRC